MFQILIVEDDKELSQLFQKVMLAERMISNKELAEMLGKDPATISKWVTNTSQPNLENLIEIARCLKCDLNDLVRLDNVVAVKPTNN